MLDVVNADFTSKASVLEVLDAWPKHAPPVFLREPQQIGERGAVSGFAGQVLLLFRDAVRSTKGLVSSVKPEMDLM